MKIEGIVFEPHAFGAGWLVEAGKVDDTEVTEARALRVQAVALQRGFFAVAGLAEGDQGYRIFVAPSDNPVAVAEAFQVGSHADYAPNAVERALTQIQAAHQRNPLVPYFADAAGFKARFSQPITDEFIAFMEETLTDVEPMMDEEEGTLGKYLRQHQSIHLWWD